MPIAEWWEALWPDPAGVLARVGILPGMEVIDLCSGDGWFTLQIDRNLQEVARHRLAESGLTNCDLVAGDAYELGKLAPRPVDFVFMANAFHGVPDRLRLVHAVRKTLKATGQFAIVNWHRRPREETTILSEPRGPKSELRLSPERTIEAVAESGLKFSRLVELPPYHYGAVFQAPGPVRVGWGISVDNKNACSPSLTPPEPG